MNTAIVKKSRTAIVYALGMALLCGAARAEEPVGTETEEEDALTFGVDFDFFSAYVWRNAVQTDRMVIEPCVWADLTLVGPLSIGGFVWQNYDLTSRRNAIFQTGLNETDFNLHLGWAAWTSDDEDYSLAFEVGHDWYTYQNVRTGEDYMRNAYPNAREIYVKAKFDNPLIGIYGQASWMYEDFGDYQKSMHYEVGLNKEIEFVEGWTLGADWNVNFGESRYLSFIYGNVDYDDTVDGVGPESGFGGTTVKLYLAWQITDWLSLKGTIAYTGILHDELRDEMREQGGGWGFLEREGNGYPRDLLWGGFSLNMEF